MIIYTVILGGYDKLRPPLVVSEHGEYVCLTDRYIDDLPPWRIKRVFSNGDSRRQARKFKILSHLYFPSAEYTLYHDGNIQFKIADPLEWLKEHDMALCAHPDRGCIYEEAEACMKTGKGDKETILRQMARYRQEGYRDAAGLVACTVILRRHTDAVRRFNEAWWDEVSNGSARDQLSFNYVCWKMGMKYDVIPGRLFDNECFQYLEHGK